MSFSFQAKLIESDEEELVPSKPTPSLAKTKKPGRHRVKKQVTKKVMESCSETDEEPEPTKDNKVKNEPPAEVKKENSVESKMIASGKNKTTVLQNNKQSSIMSFFQKK